jgi:hypothetical protein
MAAYSCLMRVRGPVSLWASVARPFLFWVERETSESWIGHRLRLGWGRQPKHEVLGKEEYERATDGR